LFSNDESFLFTSACVALIALDCSAIDKEQNKFYRSQTNEAKELIYLERANEQVNGSVALMIFLVIISNQKEERARKRELKIAIFMIHMKSERL
jgi:hypothetical protein